MKHRVLASLSHEHTRRPFTTFSHFVASMTGRPSAFVLALSIIIIWAASGSYFAFSNTWQLVINTTTTIVTFLMVFLIQNSQNRDAQAMQIKLDEIIRCTEGAHNALLDLEELTEKELIAIKKKYEALAGKARAALRKGKRDGGKPRI